MQFGNAAVAMLSTSCQCLRPGQTFLRFSDFLALNQPCILLLELCESEKASGSSNMLKMASRKKIPNSRHGTTSWKNLQRIEDNLPNALMFLFFLFDLLCCHSISLSKCCVLKPHFSSLNSSGFLTIRKSYMKGHHYLEHYP